MSVENFSGDGTADQPSIIYGFTDTADSSGLPNSIQDILSHTDTHDDDDADMHIRELSRSGWGQPGPSPGDVIERDSTKSTLDTRLPRLDLPGADGLKSDSCGNPMPAFACLNHDDDTDSDGCGKPVFVGESCYSPSCERDWPAAVKRTVVRQAGLLDAYSRILHHRTGEPVDQNHVVASLPSIVFDSDQPLKRAITVIKNILKHQWGIRGFAAIYHPYRIKKKFRADQYSHGGADGEGDMTWSDVLASDNPMQYLKFEPHIHLFFPAKRTQFSYSVVPGVYKESGWVFHRVEKPGEDNNTSVEDLEDLVHQMTYCYSHAGVYYTDDRDKFASRVKGDLATDVEYVDDAVKDQALAAFCHAAPKLLGVPFVNVANSTCDADVHRDSEIDSDGDDNDSAAVAAGDSDTDQLYRTIGGDAWPRDTLDVPVSSGSDNTAPSSTSTAVVTADAEPSEAASESDSDSPIVDDREECGGTIRPIHEAESRLDDAEWCSQAEYSAALRSAWQMWQDVTGGDEDHPWVTADEDVEYPEVTYPPD